ncbi:MAG: hypothetical protein K0S47_3068 [Herbinix sp.]|jgi:cytoskeletal protein CcmA (bactofilin family)|nr:hypothetical protein [Herbinix sp.]
MKRNIIAFGERSVSGQFGRIHSAGDLSVTNSTADIIRCAGNVSIRNSSIKKLRCAGAVSGETSDFQNVKVAGDINFHGLCKGNIVAVFGCLSADLLECKVLRNGSIDRKIKINNSSGSKWKGSFQAVTFENCFDMSLYFDYEFNNIISTGLLTGQNEIICDNFYSLGGLTGDTVNADQIFILTNSNVLMNQLVGSRVTVSNQFHPDKLFKEIPKTMSYHPLQSEATIVTIHQIEADEIKVDHMKADFVCGNNIIIGDLCIIDRVEYQSSITISDKAVVKEVVKV